MSCHVMSSHVFLRPVITCHVMSCHVMSCHVMSCHLTSSYVVSYHVMSVMSYHVMSCHVMSCHVMILQNLAPESCSRIFLPSLLNSSVRAAGWQRRGFRNRGPVRECGSERCSRCGAACTASVCVWSRAHFCRVRVAGCGDRACWRCVAGMSRACRGRAAALCRGDWARGVCTRMANVRFAWQAVGIGRVGGVARACRGCAAGVLAAPCRGDWARGVSRARMILRAVTCVSRGRCGTSEALTRSGRHWMVDPPGRCGETCIWTLPRVRFTWQVWGRVATGGVAKVDSRGRHGEARTQRAFRVAGVGNGASGGLAGHRFAWQAQGIVRRS